MKPEHAEAFAKLGPKESLAGKQYKGWDISWDYGQWSATGPGYDASYEGPENGWVDNGQRVWSNTPDGLLEEIDTWIAENP